MACSVPGSFWSARIDSTKGVVMDCQWVVLRGVTPRGEVVAGPWPTRTEAAAWLREFGTVDVPWRIQLLVRPETTKPTEGK